MVCIIALFYGFKYILDLLLGTSLHQPMNYASNNTSKLILEKYQSTKKMKKPFKSI